MLAFDNDDIEFAYVNVFRNAFYETILKSGKLNYRGMDMDKIVAFGNHIFCYGQVVRQNLPNAAMI
ncbi:MAG: hypothetical protein ACLUDU_01210 [Butyricimonas faecihominis]